MRIGIDARFLGPAGGIPRYIQELVMHLEAHNTPHEYIIFLRRANWNLYEPKNPRFHKVLADIPWYTLREQLFLTKIFHRERVDLMHFPHWNMPLAYRGKFVVTIHDLLLMHQKTRRATHLHPLFFFIKYLAYRLIIKRAIHKACALITVSEYSKNDLVKTFGVSPERVHVTYLSPEHVSPLVPGATRNELEARGVYEPYLLYVGSAYPHKNLERLIRVFDESREHGTLPQNLHLVLVGRTDAFYRRLQKAHTKKNVIFFGEASDAQLNGLLRRAHAFVFPSLFEGFGLPPLEAMQFGVPVTAANTTSVPEILGKAALLFDPKDEAAFARALVTISNDEAMRSHLRGEGYLHLQQFSWKKCTEETRKIYEHCV